MERHFEESQRIASMGSWELNLDTGEAWASPGLARVYGLPEGDPRAGDLDALTRRVHPDDRARLDAIAGAFVSGQESFTIDVRFTRLDDGRERWLHARGWSRWNERGERVLLSTVQDTTDARETERRLTDVESSIGTGAWELDVATGRIHRTPGMWRLIGADPETHPRDLDGTLARLPLRTRNLLEKAVRDAMETGEPQRARIPYLRPDGIDVVLETRMRAERDASGRVARVLALFSDVTQEVAEEERAEASRRRAVEQERLAVLGTLVAGVNHEIANALTLLTMSTTLGEMDAKNLVEDASLAPATKKAAADFAKHNALALKGVDQIARISKSLRTVYKIAPGARAEMPASAPCETALTLAGPRLPMTVDVTREYAATRVARANEGEIAQVVLNLVLNAGDAMSTQATGTVVVRTRDAPEGGVLIEVEDSGPGIPPEVAARLFTPFFTTKSAGTGLGLSVSRRIVEGHEGTLTFETTPGKGTTFRVALPAA